MAGAGLMVIWLITATDAQSIQSSSVQTTSTGEPDKSMVLVGCVSAAQANDDQVTLADPKAGVTYRLSGTKLRTYTGHRVRIVGGLYPSTNVAAQAGAIDPTKAAIAATTSSNAGQTGPVELPKFHVTQVRKLKGSCVSSASK